MASNPDPLRPWDTLDSKIVFETPYFKIREEHMKTSRGAEVDYFFHDARDSAICVCVDDNNNVLIEKQYRPAVGKVSIDYPAGRMEADDKSTESLIRREAEEEAGLSISSIQKLGVIDKEPNFSSSRMHVYLAKGTLSGPTHLEPTESIVTEFVSPSAVLDLIATGKMNCAFCVSATFFAFKKLGWLTVAVSG
jgi:ADP-ribose pyrophosphatase